MPCVHASEGSSWSRPLPWFLLPVCHEMKASSAATLRHSASSWPLGQQSQGLGNSVFETRP